MVGGELDRLWQWGAPGAVLGSFALYLIRASRRRSGGLHDRQGQPRDPVRWYAPDLSLLLAIGTVPDVLQGLYMLGMAITGRRSSGRPWEDADARRSLAPAPVEEWRRASRA